MGRGISFIPRTYGGGLRESATLVFAVLIGVYLALPFIRVAGRPAVFFDLLHRRFFLFGASFNAQDFWLFFFVLTGIALALIVVTTVWGRVWCGYACPQTVFLEGVYRRIERWVEGPRQQRMKRNAGPWNADKIVRKSVKHAIFLLLSLFFSHFVLSYFVSLPSLFQMVLRSPAEHPAAFGWMVAMTAILYANFSWFREQLCLIVCPYGRLQSTMTDRSTLVIGYDTARGEPRGKKSKRQPKRETGDCVDCSRCVQVCPTGIDIRNGLQMECIGCAACVDACDEVMTKLQRPRGLIRYDSLNGFESVQSKTRPRLFLYGAALLIWAVAAGFAFSDRQSFEANLLRVSGGSPFSVNDGVVQNNFTVHLVNKSDALQSYTVGPISEDEGLDYLVSMPTVELPGGAGRQIPIVVRTPHATLRRGLEVQLRIMVGEETKVVAAPFLGPGT